MSSALNTPWKLSNWLCQLLCWPLVCIQFALNGIPFGRGWRFYGLPIIQKHRQSTMRIGDDLKLRSSIRSNPLGPNHPVILCTWNARAVLEIGNDFAMTGGTICTFEHITIGAHVMVGSNCTIIDTDFHPAYADLRRRDPMNTKPVPITIGNDVFIGMNSTILKGVKLGDGCVIGAGSVVTRDVPAGMLASGNPARDIRPVQI